MTRSYLHTPALHVLTRTDLADIEPGAVGSHPDRRGSVSVLCKRPVGLPDETDVAASKRPGLAVVFDAWLRWRDRDARFQNVIPAGEHEL